MRFLYCLTTILDTFAGVQATDRIEFLETGILFQNKSGQKFRMVPVHLVSKEKVTNAFFDLFQDKEVFKYYETGNPKTEEECKALVTRVGDRFKDWKKDILGWTLILSGEKLLNEETFNDHFVGFFGAAVTKENPPEKMTPGVEVCFAIKSKQEFRRTKIVTHALYEYFLNVWPHLNGDLSEKIQFCESPVNPKNIASVAFFKSIGGDECVGKEPYISKYYKDRKDVEEEKKWRVDTRISIKTILSKAKDYQSKKSH